MELDCQTKRDLKVKQMRLFLFLFSFSTPRKNDYSFTAEQEGSGNGKNVCGAISSDSTCAKDLKSPKEGSL
jgi:hypothetical protein